MSKRNKGRNMKGDKQTVGKADVGKVPAEVVQAATATTPQAASTATPTVQARTTSHPGKIKLLRTDVRYKGNREAWFNRLKEYDGKTLDEFLTSASEKPPALTRNGTPEPPMGWFSFFKREQVAAVVQG